MAVQPRTATVVIYQGDYLDRIRDLERRAETAEQDTAPPRRMGERSEFADLVAQHNALVEEADASALRVVVRALKRSEWKQLVGEHPPREGNKGDASVGVNEDTFKEALVPASIVEPAGFADDDLDYLSDVDFDRLYLTAFALNRGAAAAPKALPVSRGSRENDAT